MMPAPIIQGQNNPPISGFWTRLFSIKWIIQTEAERRRRETGVQQSIENGLGSCVHVYMHDCIYVLCIRGVESWWGCSDSDFGSDSWLLIDSDSGSDSDSGFDTKYKINKTLIFARFLYFSTFPSGGGRGLVRPPPLAFRN